MHLNCMHGTPDAAGTSCTRHASPSSRIAACAAASVTTKRAGNAKAMAGISNRCLSDLPVSQFSHSARNAC
jgi:hypothetical protein